MKFKYDLTPNCCSEKFSETGIRPTPHRVIIVDPIKASRELREFYENFKNCDEVQLASQDRELEESEILPLLRAADLQIKQTKIEEVSRQAAREILFAQYEAKNSAEAEAQDARLAEKERWANEHGSEHLKRGIEAGHCCERLYITERAEIEFPEFIPDFDDIAIWGILSCPSLEALDILALVPNTKIVWIKRRHDCEPDEYDYDSDEYYPDDAGSNPGEAVLIRNYLGFKLDLIRYT